MRWLRDPDLLPSLLLVSAAWALGVATHSSWFAIAVSVVLATHWLVGLRLPGQPRLFTTILLALPFALWFRYMPTRGFTGFAPIDALVMAGMYLVALGAHHVLCSRTGGSRPLAVAWALVGIAMAAMVPRTIHTRFEPVTIGFMGLIILALRDALTAGERSGNDPPRPIGRLSLRRWVLIYLAGMALLVLGWTVHTQLVSRAPVMGRWLARKLAPSLPPDSAGFQRTAALGSLAAQRDEARDAQIALRVWGEQPDTHLRGAVFDRYSDGVWRQIPESAERKPVGAAGGRHQFALTDRGGDVGSPAQWGPPQAIAYPEADMDDAIFLPLGARSIAAFGDAVMASEALSARSPARASAGGYAWYAARAPLSGPTDHDLAVPPSLREPLQRIARDILNPGDDPARSAARLEAYFSEHFRYKLGIDPPAGKDPVLSFLEDIRAAHCEYFAAAGALLLRSNGIPARYVTGFVVQERGWSRNLWQARRKDAHAWVEMWTTDRGWVTIDPTPPEGRPSAHAATSGQRVGEWVMGWLARLRRVVAHAGVLGLLALAWTTLTDALLATPWWMWLLVIVAAGLWAYRKQIMGGWRRRRRETVTERIAAMRAVLSRAEQMGRRAGVPRQPWMPVGDYLRLIRAAPMREPARRAVVDMLNEYQRRRFRRE